VAEVSTAIPLVMSFDLEEMLRSKKAFRERLAARPIAEKLRILDAMRERALAIRSATVGKLGLVQEMPAGCGKGTEKKQ
jgi:hypothetical protein